LPALERRVDVDVTSGVHDGWSRERGGSYSTGARIAVSASTVWAASVDMMAIAWAWSCCWRLADTGGGPGEGDGVPGTAGGGLYAASFAWSACHCWCTGSSFAFASASEATMCESAGPLAKAASRIAWMDSSIWS